MSLWTLDKSYDDLPTDKFLAFLVGGSNPIEKNICQIGSSPQVGMNMKTYLKPVLLCVLQSFLFFSENLQVNWQKEKQPSSPAFLLSSLRLDHGIKKPDAELDWLISTTLLLSDMDGNPKKVIYLRPLEGNIHHF